LRIGLASDSHGNIDLLDSVLQHFAAAKVDRVFFLGDRCGDVEAVLVRAGLDLREEPVPRTDSEFLAAIEGALARQASPQDPLGSRMVRVASRECPEYESGALPRKQMDLVEGRICCLVHDKSALDRDDISNASVIFHGNSTQAALVQIGPRTFVTPGHLRESAPDGRPPSYGIVDFGEREIVMSVFGADGSALKQLRASFGAGGKMSVR
jgi:predicted phosphodiesterase